MFFIILHPTCTAHAMFIWLLQYVPPATLYSPHGIQPYNLKMLTKQIKVCSGYNNEVSIPEPPYNMCISHQESYEVSPQSSQPFHTTTVVHYHANPEIKNPSFVSIFAYPTISFVEVN